MPVKPRQIVPVFSDTIASSVQPQRIVPIQPMAPTGVAAPFAANNLLVNHGGPVIGSGEVIPIYWGAAWATGTNATLSTQLDGFFDYIVTSPLMDLLHEYSTASTQIQHGRRLQSVRVSNSEPGTVTPAGRQVTDA